MRRARFSEDQGGFSLIEVVISAAILLTVTMGTLALIDGSQDVQAQNRGRTTAASLAEQDQEQLRSTNVLTLAGVLDGGRTGFTRTRDASLPSSNPSYDPGLLVGGVPYRVTSTAEWQRDATGLPPSCNDTDGMAEYLRITSVASDARGNAGVKPVTLTSLMTPPPGSLGRNTGTLSVQVTGRTNVDGSAAGQAGLPVAITGPQAASQNTNAAGCAVFNYFPLGGPPAQPYTINISRPGGTFPYVDPDGKTSISATATLSSGESTKIVKRYDQSVTLNATVNAGAPNNEVWGVTATNDTNNVVRTVTSATQASTAVADKLFPFADGYGVYSGVCPANDPTKYGGTSTLVPGMTPGSAANVAVSQPQVKVTMLKNGSVPLKNVVLRVTATLVDDSCNVAAKYKKYVLTPTTNASTGEAAISLPWGPYRFCMSYYESSTKKTYSLTAPDPVTVVNGFPPVPVPLYEGRACP